MMAFVVALVFGGTQAFFSDEETSEGNTFTAGAIDLLVDSEAHYDGLVCENGQWVDDPNVDEDTSRPELLGEDCNGTWTETDLGPEHQFFNYSDLKPGDHGENTISLHVYDNDAWACAIIDNMQDNDNGCNEPETEAEEDAYGEGQETCGDGEGELSSELRFFAWAEEDGDNIWEDGEPILFSNTEGPASDVIDGVVYPLFTPDLNNAAVLEATTTAYIGLYWCYGAIDVDENNNTLGCDGAGVSNLTQTDSMSADITFYVEQVRNNPNFQCPVLEEQTGTLTLLKDVVNAFGGSAVDADWTLFADGPDSVSGMEGDPAVTSATVAVGTYDLSESGLAGYTASAWVCVGGTQDDDDTVTIAEGEDVTCTITNTEEAPQP